MGLFHAFLDDSSVKIVGVEAGGHGVNSKMEHAASLTGGKPGVLHGNRTYLLQDEDGQIIFTEQVQSNQAVIELENGDLVIGGGNAFLDGGYGGSATITRLSFSSSL